MVPANHKSIPLFHNILKRIEFVLTETCLKNRVLKKGSRYYQINFTHL